MKTRSSRIDAGDEQRAAATPEAAQFKQAPVATMADARPATLAQLQHQAMASNSSQAAQLKARAESMAGRTAETPLQRVADEELLQGKFDPVQRREEEETLQGKFEPVQRAADDELLQGKFAPGPTAQLAHNGVDGGLPGELKSGIESLSGMSMDHVKVHYNSDKPAQLNAHAYAQGSDIHMAPGQERHLPHEAWHVVQQAQGRVRPTMQMKGDTPVNDDAGLESEADVMGAKAVELGVKASSDQGGT